MVLSLERWQGKTAVVTGASVGIGASIAEHLVKAGINVVGLARRKENIEALAKKLAGEKGKLYALKADLRKEEEILAAFEWMKANLGPVHILINNAGLNRMNELINGNTENWRHVVDVNVLGLCIATREAINAMKEHQITGHIIHINSVLGHKLVNVPFMNIYPATKHAVTALAETLRLELKRMGSKIKITSLSPGLVDSEFFKEADYDFEAETTEMFSKIEMLKPEDVADAVLYALSTPPYVLVKELTVMPVDEAL